MEDNELERRIGRNTHPTLVPYLLEGQRCLLEVHFGVSP